MINKILFFTLSNLGDVILTLPVMDVLLTRYPQSSITVMVGPRTSEIFKDNPYIGQLIVYNKYAPLREKINLFFQLKRENFDLVVDLRNTLFGALLPARFKTSPFLYVPSRIRHMKERNLYRLKVALRQNQNFLLSPKRFFYIRDEDEVYVDAILQDNGITERDKIIIVNPIAGGATRRWAKEKFIQLCQILARNYSVILVGRDSDRFLTGYIQSVCTERIFDFAGLTSLSQLSCLLKKSSLVITCDTGILHLASYFNVPIVAMFGPSDEQRYGPWSDKYRVVVAATACRPCRMPNCRFNTFECMRDINVNTVLDSIDALLKS